MGIIDTIKGTIENIINRNKNNKSNQTSSNNNSNNQGFSGIGDSRLINPPSFQETINKQIKEDLKQSSGQTAQPSTPSTPSSNNQGFSSSTSGFSSIGSSSRSSRVTQATTQASTNTQQPTTQTQPKIFKDNAEQYFQTKQTFPFQRQKQEENLYSVYGQTMRKATGEEVSRIKNEVLNRHTSIYVTSGNINDIALQVREHMENNARTYEKLKNANWENTFISPQEKIDYIKTERGTLPIASNEAMAIIRSKNGETSILKSEIIDEAKSRYLQEREISEGYEKYRNQPFISLAEKTGISKLINPYDPAGIVSVVSTIRGKGQTSYDLERKFYENIIRPSSSEYVESGYSPITLLKESSKIAYASPSGQALTSYAVGYAGGVGFGAVIGSLVKKWGSLNNALNIAGLTLFAGETAKSYYDIRKSNLNSDEKLAKYVTTSTNLVSGGFGAVSGFNYGFRLSGAHKYVASPDDIITSRSLAVQEAVTRKLKISEDFVQVTTESRGKAIITAKAGETTIAVYSNNVKGFARNMPEDIPSFIRSKGSGEAFLINDNEKIKVADVFFRTKGRYIPKGEEKEVDIGTAFGEIKYGIAYKKENKPLIKTKYFGSVLKFKKEALVETDLMNFEEGIYKTSSVMSDKPLPITQEKNILIFSDKSYQYHIETGGYKLITINEIRELPLIENKIRYKVNIEGGKPLSKELYDVGISDIFDIYKKPKIKALPKIEDTPELINTASKIETTSTRYEIPSKERELERKTPKAYLDFGAYEAIASNIAEYFEAERIASSQPTIHLLPSIGASFVNTKTLSKTLKKNEVTNQQKQNISLLSIPQVMQNQNREKIVNKNQQLNKILESTTPMQQIVPIQQVQTLKTMKSMKLATAEKQALQVPTSPIKHLSIFNGYNVIGGRIASEPEFKIKGIGGKNFKEVNISKISKRYTPSMTALTFNIKGKKQEKLTGLEIRPIIYFRSYNKKRRGKK